jgi:arginyl-tRNA synthetase
VLHAVCRAVEDGALRVPVPESVSVERPRPGGRGDYATNVALRLAGPAGQQARVVAEILRARVEGAPGVERVEVTGPGFLNFTLGRDAGTALLRTVRASGARYGHGGALDGVRVRFAPVGELRARVLTDAVVQLLRAQGAVADVEPGGQERLRAVPAPEQDLVERLGSDPARWALLSAAAHDRPRRGEDFLVQREINPLFKIRYAYSRSRALTRDAARLGFDSAPESPVEAVEAIAVEALDAVSGDELALEAVALDELALEAVAVDEAAADAVALTAAIGDHPVVVAAAARHRTPDRLARQLEGTADAFLAFHHSVLPIGDEKPMAAHRSRLALAEAAGVVLAGGLSLLGISAPEHL